MKSNLLLKDWPCVPKDEGPETDPEGLIPSSGSDLWWLFPGREVEEVSGDLWTVKLTEKGTGPVIVKQQSP